MKLSIIIPTYNSESTINRTFTSIKNSTYKNYELIVIDDGSKDNTLQIAKKYTNKVIKLPTNVGRDKARAIGLQESKGEIVVNIDSDIIISSISLKIIADFFKNNPKVQGVTGLLSKKHPNKNWASQYKNLYMNYHFMKLPERVNFFYGSIYAYRKSDSQYVNRDRRAKIADDTEAGQQFIKNRQKIILLKDLEVIHLKKYTLFSLIKNDYIIPRDWAKIFLNYQGWKQLGKNGTGFAHASTNQIISLFLAPISLLFIIVTFVNHLFVGIFIFLVVLWFTLNFDFFLFLCKERGSIFTIKAILFTFVDHIVMMVGIIFGTLNYKKMQ